MQTNDIIVCLMGKSGSGKTALADVLRRYHGFNVIKSFTTRTPRPGESGDEYYFVDQPPAQPDADPEIITYAEHNGAHYWTERSQYKGKGCSAFVVEPIGAQLLKQEVNDALVVIIYLEVEEEERYRRMRKQGRRMGDYRIYADGKKFNYSLLPCDYIINGTFQDPDDLAFSIASEMENIQQNKEGVISRWKKAVQSVCRKF